MFEHKKKPVDVVIDMRAVTTAGCHFWLGEQGVIVRPETVPPLAIVVIRAVEGRAAWPRNQNWTYLDLVKLPAPRSQWEVCEFVPVATPAAEVLPTPEAKAKLTGASSSSSPAAENAPRVPGLQPVRPPDHSALDDLLLGREPVAHRAPTLPMRLS
eukprot:6662472-Pyramimonas_sp.AAC.1